MEIIAGQVQYYVYIYTEGGTTINVTQAIFGLGWEENEDELSVQIKFQMYNALVGKKRLSSMVKVGQTVVVKANWGAGQHEVARGTIEEAERNTSKSDESFTIVAHDILYAMQKSQDNVYYAAGKTTKSLITELFGKWSIPVGEYTGPDVTHNKIVYKNKNVSDIILGLLDEAVKNGGPKAVIRAENGKVSVVKKAGNKDVFVFTGKNSITSNYKISIADLVTRVVVVSTEEKEEAPKVQSTVDGKTEFGIRQKILTYAKDDNLEDTKATAEQMIKDEGEPQKTLSLEAPDVPVIRKGDKIKVKVGALNGEFLVKSIQHNAATGKMKMSVEEYNAELEEQDEEEEKDKEYKVGDIVYFHGGMHYVSSYPDATGYYVKPGPARINIANGSGKAHPWSLITEDWDQTHVWGWVDDGSFD